MNGPKFDEVKATPQTFRRSVARMLAVLARPEMRRWRLRMVGAFAVTALAKAVSVGAPVLMGKGVDAAIEGAGAGAAAGGFIGFFLLFGLARFIANALPQARDAFFTRVTQDANRLLAVDAYAHAQNQSLHFHVTRRAGAINRIIERGAASVEFMLRFLAFNIGPTIVELAFAAAVMALLYSWSIALAAIATVAAYAVFTIVVTEWRNKFRRVMNEADTELRAMAADTMANFETVKAFGAEARETARYDTAIRDYSDRYVRSMQSMQILNAGQEFVMAAGLVAAACLAGYGAVQGDLKPGDITAVILMLTNIYRPMNILGFAWREIKQGAVDIEKLFDLLDLTPDVRDAPHAVAFSPRGGAIRFEDVVFAYEGRAGGVSGLNLDVPAGAFIGVVGPSGAGKSTLLRLLFRFYDPEKGRVLIDDQDVRGVTQDSLRHAMGLVPQDVVLFNDTLRFNLAYGRPGASDADVLDAARRAQLGDFIAAAPDGLDARVGERGMKLSGGEKQRVGLARAILLDPPILVLDEATSALDSATERDVQNALRAAAVGRTTIAVAHRLSTVSGADAIFVLDQGRVVETGDHATLIARNGLYASLWKRQSTDAARRSGGDQPTSAAPAAH
ncbi:MAG: ABC transporter ATP-binding protein/permease [Pseudomonadota bacterium]